MPIDKNSILFINTLCTYVIRKPLYDKYLAEYMAIRGVGFSLQVISWILAIAPRSEWPSKAFVTEG